MRRLIGVDVSPELPDRSLQQSKQMSVLALSSRFLLYDDMKFQWNSFVVTGDYTKIKDFRASLQRTGPMVMPWKSSAASWRVAQCRKRWAGQRWPGPLVSARAPISCGLHFVMFALSSFSFQKWLRDHSAAYSSRQRFRPLTAQGFLPGD